MSYDHKTCAVDHVDIGSALLRPVRLTPGDFKQLLKKSGWRLADAALRWNVRAETLSRIAANPDRDRCWDDLVRALPVLTRRERAAVTAARLQLQPPRPRLIQVAPGDRPTEAVVPTTVPAPFVWDEDDADAGDSVQPHSNGFRCQEYVGRGSELVVVNEMGSFAAVGAVLLVIDTRLSVDDHAGAQEEYLCRSPAGDTLWLQPAQLDDWLVSTGRTRPVHAS